ncbi:MAG: hypothetical protein H6607_00785 [Flavobacteriales bacterium]|nr:hypothetical protein [Flavobacteriales bacterium]
MRFTKIVFSTVIWLASFKIASAQQRSVIELLDAESIEFDQDFVDAERVKGHVKFRQDNVYMDCDSAYFYRKQNRIEAFGHIYIRQQDTLNLWGDYAEYDGDKKIAHLRKNVRLKDQQMELTTDLLQYDLNTKTGYYTTGGKINNGQDKLESRIGRYHSRSKEFFFKDKVKLNNPEYTMTSDTLRYNTVSKVAYFYGPTYIKSNENTIFCRNGWYDTRNNTSQFSKGAWISGKDNKLIADSLAYNRNTGVGQAFRNITLIDTLEQIKLRGEYGINYRNEKRTLVSGNPLAIKYLDGDSLFLKADTLIDITETDGDRKLLAFHHTKIHKTDMQGVSDSLVYNFTDSTISMFGQPIIWTENNQVSGDTIIVYRKVGGLDKMHILNDAFIASQEKEDAFNQISGRNMFAYFVSNKLNRVDVKGNGQSIYYAREEDSSYTGVNHIICSDMLIFLENNKVNEITFYTKPSGGFYPVNQLPEDKKRLPDFEWHDDKRPTLQQFLEQKQQQEDNLPEGVKDLNGNRNKPIPKF